MRLIVLDNDYPSNDNLYGDVFAHVRVKNYCLYFKEVLVLANLYNTPKNEESFDGVDVLRPGSITAVKEIIKTYKPDLILVHFYQKPLEEIILDKNYKSIIWVHGFEALGWYRRLFNLKFGRSLPRIILSNIKQQLALRKIIKVSNNENRIKFVFVSQWMKRLTEFDAFIKSKRSIIIPNPIDNKLFFFEQKLPELRKNILIIRPFYSKKYATDIICQTIEILSKEKCFKELNFTIYGAGSKTSRLFDLFGDHKNIEINEGFLTQYEIKKLHSGNGIFLCPTRQDAQGVSMCEAMSSGLVPITSNNTAIPEFVMHNESGILTNNSPIEVADAILRLYSSPELFIKLQCGASQSIIKKAGLAEVVQKEVNLIQETFAE